MARITVIKSDGFVAIDGEGYLKCDVSFLDDTVHAIQWYDTDGEIERKDARGRIRARSPDKSAARIALKGNHQVTWRRVFQRNRSHPSLRCPKFS
jgi:hypothetical protein